MAESGKTKSGPAAPPSGGGAASSAGGAGKAMTAEQVPGRGEERECLWACAEFPFPGGDASSHDVQQPEPVARFGLRAFRGRVSEHVQSEGCRY